MALRIRGRFDLRGVGGWREGILGASLFLCPAATRWLALDVVRKRLQICQWWNTSCAFLSQD